MPGRGVRQGDVTLKMAALVGAESHVVGIDHEEPTPPHDEAAPAAQAGLTKRELEVLPLVAKG